MSVEVVTAVIDASIKQLHATDGIISNNDAYYCQNNNCPLFRKTITSREPVCGLYNIMRERTLGLSSVEDANKVNNNVIEENCHSIPQGCPLRFTDILQ